MSGDLLDMMDDGTEKRGETSFMDLPDKALIQIISGLDFASRFKLRLNKRLVGLDRCVENRLDTIEIDLDSTGSKLRLKPSKKSRPSGQLETRPYVERIEIRVFEKLNKQHIRIIDSLSHIEAGLLRISNWGGALEPWFEARPWQVSSLPQITLPTSLHFAQNIRSVYIEFPCPNISVQDLWRIRKTMHENGCKLENFYMEVDEKKAESFLRACSGVTIKRVKGTRPGRIFHTTDNLLDLYSSDTELIHMGDKIETWIGENNFIVFKKRTASSIDQSMGKVVFGHLYTD
ncbi:hypothetical protein PENTCL1PPCAC_19558 [Pristionchus entomophagus]|uniref:F-box domain-containing protein n=1 Tax=Pristionchus entomophagus TaxID=358040 RepID=A0AAV5TTL4_9BILA|nr:hypothetical protein PENTCL1PPCAC_19558 [Pristionchus entomophagus]